MPHIRLIAPTIITTIMMACAPVAPGGQQSQADTPSSAVSQARTLVMVLRQEPPSVASKPLREAGSSVASATRLFNAELDYVDEREVAHPYLAEALPQLHTESWRVFPDGRMETSYRLRPNITWHDGTPFSAEDYAFAWRVYRTPELGASTDRPLNLIEEVLAPDARTVAIRWRQPYPEADALGGTFQALPRHILEAPFQSAASNPEGFLGNPFWSNEYVGVGPYRLDRWEPGAFLEGVAFAGHVLGRPRIERVRLLFMPDANVVLAALLSGSAHIAVDNSLKYEQSAILEREWGPRTEGVILLSPSQWRSTEFQFRPELVNPPAILDLRVRRAFAHAMDRQALNEILLGGKGIVPDTPISPLAAYNAAIDRVTTKYPHDARRAEALFAEAGFTRGSDGFLTNAGADRFRFELWTIAGVQNEVELPILMDTFRRLGLDVTPHILGAAQLADRRVRSSFPALSQTSGGGGESGLVGLRSAPPGPENQGLGGGGRGGWANAEFDRFVDAFNTSLDRSERTEHIVQMARIFSEQLPKVPLFFSIRVTAHVATLSGPLLSTTPEAGSESWNVHEWAWR